MASRSSSGGDYSTDPLILNIYPGNSGSVSIYDDHGNSNDYKKGDFIRTDVNFSKKGGSLKIIIKPVTGSYSGMTETRAFMIRLALTLPPHKVIVNDELISYDRELGASSWNYDGNDLATKILTKSFSAYEKITIKVELSDYDIELLSAKKGQFKELVKFIKFLAKNNWDKSKYSNDLMVHAAQTGHRININPDNAYRELQVFDAEWQDVLEMLEVSSTENDLYRPYLELLKTADWRRW